MRRQNEESAYDWLTVVGIDVPYPPAVAEALERVERETKRLEQATCEHRFDSYQTHIGDDGLIAWKVWQCSRCDFERRDECQHEHTERFLLRKMNGEPCIDEVRCEDCGASPVPDDHEWTSFKAERLRQAHAALPAKIAQFRRDVEQLRPYRRGRLAESSMRSIDCMREDERG